MLEVDFCPYHKIFRTQTYKKLVKRGKFDSHDYFASTCYESLSTVPHWQKLHSQAYSPGGESLKKKERCGTQ